MLANKKILLISPEPWEHIFVSKHHYAITLTKKGNTVFFLNPPSSQNRCADTTYQNIFTIDYKPFIRGLNLMPELLARKVSALDVNKVLRLAQTEFDVIWSFDPYRFQHLDLFKAPVNIYFAADWHAARKKERLLADHAQLVLSPSRVLLNQIGTGTPKLFLNHGVADYFFGNAIMKTLPGNNVVKVGYVGNLKSKFLNYDLLKQVIQVNYECDFIFVGEHKIPALSSFSNVFFAGLFTNEKVASFLKACHILLLCYDTDQYPMEASNSHKIMEYLSSGKIVVSTRIGEYINLSGLILMPDKNDELPQLLERVCKDLPAHHDETLRQKRIKFAKENLYDRQLQAIEQKLAEIGLNSAG